MPGLALATAPITRDDPAYDADIAAAAQRWLDSLPDALLACYRNHDFPKLRVTKGKLGKGITARHLPQRQGHYAITQICVDCKTQRTYTCTANDIFASGRHYEYDWPEGYNMPKGGTSYISWADIQAERNRRFAEAIASLASAA